jgi:hypothetical protein
MSTWHVSVCLGRLSQDGKRHDGGFKLGVRSSPVSASFFRPMTTEKRSARIVLFGLSAADGRKRIEGIWEELARMGAEACQY